jgi:hypothetical protein
MPFGAGLRKLRNENAGNRIKSIYERGRSGESLEAVLSDFCGGPASLAAAQQFYISLNAAARMMCTLIIYSSMHIIMQRIACRPPERPSAIQGGAAAAPKGLIPRLFVRFHGRRPPPAEISGPPGAPFKRTAAGRRLHFNILCSLPKTSCNIRNFFKILAFGYFAYILNVI